MQEQRASRSPGLSVAGVPIVKFLDDLGAGINVEIVIAALPEAAKRWF